MILILTESSDPNTDHVIEILKTRGAEFVRFHTEDFPARAGVSIGYGPDGRMRLLLRVGGTTVDLTRVQSVWNRRPQPPVPHEQIVGAATRGFVTDECHSFLHDLWNAVDCRWLPGPPTTIRLGEYKASHMRVAAQLGFELPPTLFTSDPDEFLNFYQQHNGNVVSKLAGFGWHRNLGDTFVRYTEVVSKRDLGYAASIRHCPVILQAYVPKRLELRVTVVGRKVFAAEIYSQETHHTRHDWRRYDLGNTPHLVHDLPPKVQEQCVRLVEALELSYGAIDLILTPDGRYVFIEINPTGQYLWIEEKTGLPISAAICDWLMAEEGAAP